MSRGLSSAAYSVRNQLYVQAALTLLFALTRGDGSQPWTALTVVVAVAAVGLGSALHATPPWRTAVLGYEGLAVGYGALALASNHWVPGSLIGLVLALRLTQVSPSEWAAVAPVVPLELAAAPPVPPALPVQGPPLDVPAPAPPPPPVVAPAPACVTILPS